MDKSSDSDSVHENVNIPSDQYEVQSSVEETAYDEEQALINIDQLIDILGDEETIKEIMPTYLDDNKKHYKELTEAMQNNDAESVRRHAHAIKGAGQTSERLVLLKLPVNWKTQVKAKICHWHYHYSMSLKSNLKK